MVLLFGYCGFCAQANWNRADRAVGAGLGEFALCYTRD